VTLGVQTVKPVLRQHLWLGSSLLATWLVLSLPVVWFAGNSSLLWMGLAAVLCFLPGSLVLTLQPLWKVAGIAGLGAMSGMLLRMVAVISGVLAVAVGYPRASLLVFTFGASVFYLVALLVETLLVVSDIDREAV
jgi:hypothetical protein